ncbi:reticulon-1 isoform X1 [Dromiciops gliroides]|uniref:reticulon-1 isoform X1 n=1 Tax=Dromiciops gliroides TaxID=33562 RepID=UPI001CC55276|nr:reticulon-1 isoform X1 [Dromiciops gliroides]
MSVPPDQKDELLLLAGSGSQWFGDGREEEEETVTMKGFHRPPSLPQQQYPAGETCRSGGESVGEGAQQELGSGKDRQEEKHPPVAMETASTGVADDPYARDHTSPASAKEEGAFYTSLISDVNCSSQQDSMYFTGILQKEDSHATSLESTEELNARGPSLQDASGLESHGLFSSDSGIEMTPAECTDVNKTLADPLAQMKAEAYKYIDISRPEEIKYQEPWESSQENKDSDFKNECVETSIKSECTSEPEIQAPMEAKGAKEHLLEESTFAPYINDLSEDQHCVSLVTAPVKITLTEIEPVAETSAQEKTLEKQDTCLKSSHETVPTVTVSEPEDDSPESMTPPSSATEPSGSESQGKGSFSEDELISAIKEAKGLSLESTESPQAVGQVPDKPEPPNKSGPPAAPCPLDHEASSAESGDSEIELVSEDPLAAEEVLQSSYMSFSHISGPPPSPASPSIQYSILREEREAELDSELIIESCDASSASEESPKREQDSPLMKPIIMDIIKEENGSRTENLGASKYDGNNSAKESKMNRQNLAESASYLKCSYVPPQISTELPMSEGRTEELKGKLSQKKTADVTGVCQSNRSPKDSGQNIWSSPPLLFLNKQKAIDLLYWRDIKQTGIVFGSFLLLLFSLTQFSVVSVVAYLALAALSATISFRIYKSVLQAVQKTDEGHPFKAYLELEISLSQDQIQKYTDYLQLYVNSAAKELRRLFLVQDLVDSLKFAVLMWLLTYVGALFNGLTLLIMAVVSMFTLPVVYFKHQAQIDQYLGLVRTHVNTIVGKIQAKIPGAKRQTE